MVNELKFKIGDKVKINDYIENDSYNEYKNQILVITSGMDKGDGYDSALFPQGLYTLETQKTNEEIPFMLYDYELEDI